MNTAVSTNKNTCGREDYPCFSINFCTKKRYKNIKIIGRYVTPQKDVNIIRDINIFGDKDTVVTCGKKSFVRIPKKKSAKVTISNIRFHKFKKDPVIRIIGKTALKLVNCTFTGSTAAGVYLDVNAHGVTVKMQKTSFKNTGGYMILKEMNKRRRGKGRLVFILEDCDQFGSRFPDMLSLTSNRVVRTV